MIVYAGAKVPTLPASVDDRHSGDAQIDLPSHRQTLLRLAADQKPLEGSR